MAEETLREKLHALQQQRNGAAACMALTVCFVALHFIAALLRRNQRSILDWNQTFILASLCSFVAMTALVIVNAGSYMAFYTADDQASKAEDYVTTLKTTYAISVLYPVASVLPKLSLCVLYLRIFGVSVWVRRITYSMIIFLAANTVAWLVPSIIVCRPISAFWSLDGDEGTCINYIVLGTWISLPSLVTDMVMLILPMPVLWNTQMSVSKKLGLIITFSTGSIGIVGACLRLGWYIRQYYVEQPGVEQTTSSIAVHMTATHIECGMYLMAACMPSCRVLFTRLHKVVTNSFNSFLQGRRTYPSDENGSPHGNKGSDESSHKGSDKMPVDKVFVKLTGLGNLSTLAREGQNIGVTRAESGWWEKYRPFDDEEARAKSPNDMEGSTPVCHICQCVRRPASKPLPATPRPIIE